MGSHPQWWHSPKASWRSLLLLCKLARGRAGSQTRARPPAIRALWVHFVACNEKPGSNRGQRCKQASSMLSRTPSDLLVGRRYSLWACDRSKTQRTSNKRSWLLRPATSAQAAEVLCTSWRWQNRSLRKISITSRGKAHRKWWEFEVMVTEKAVLRDFDRRELFVPDDDWR